MNRRLDIASVPEDINTCMSQPNEESSTELQHLWPGAIEKLRRKFLPLSSPSPFFQDIFDLVMNTCSVPTCKIDHVINLLERASARHDSDDESDHDHDHDHTLSSGSGAASASTPALPHLRLR